MTDSRPASPRLQVPLERNSQPQVSEPHRLSNWAPEATLLISAAALAPQSPPLTRMQAERLRPNRRAPSHWHHGTGNLSGEVARVLDVKTFLLCKLVTICAHLTFVHTCAHLCTLCTLCSQNRTIFQARHHPNCPPCSHSTLTTSHRLTGSRSR